MILVMFLLSIALGVLWVLGLLTGAAVPWFLWSVAAFVLVLAALSAGKLFWRKDLPFGLPLAAVLLLLAPVWIAALAMHAAAAWVLWPVFGVGVVAAGIAAYLLADELAIGRERRVTP